MLFGVCCAAGAASADTPDRDPERFAGAIARFERADLRDPPGRGGVVFVGSSSVRRLEPDRVFPEIDLIQRGFGGAHIPDVIYYADQLIVKHQPTTVVFFCGGNDLWVGHTVEQVAEDFEDLATLLLRRLPRCRLIALAVRPSPKRRRLIDSVLELNERLEEYARTDKRIIFLRGSCDRFLDDDGEPIASMYADDEQHMNEAGYAVWAELLAPYLVEYRRDAPTVSHSSSHE